MKIKKSVLSIPVMFQKDKDVIGSDERFTKVKIWLMHLGENFNGSFFDKEIVDNAIDTLSYIPIVGFIEENKLGENDFSDHRYIITRDENGIKRKYVGIPYGVILSKEDNNAHYEERLCDDGITRTFLVVDGVLWNMFEDSIEILNRDVIKPHSMELWDSEDSIDGYEDDNGFFHFTKFSFRAACILGNDYEPAMINSTVELQFTMDDFIKNFQCELSNKLASFTKIVNETNNKGGIENMPNLDYAQTLLEQFSDIASIVEKQEVLIDRWGDEVPRFYLHDIQDNEIIVVDRTDYHFYGFSFTIDGDKPVIDFTSGKRKKICFEDYIETEDNQNNEFDFGKHITEIEDNAFNKVEEANLQTENANKEKEDAETNYNKIKEEYEEIKPKYDDYVLAEQHQKEEQLRVEKDSKFAEYEEVLSGNEDFTKLKKRRDEMSVEEIEKECAVLYAKITLPKSTFSKTKASSVSVGVSVSDEGMDDNCIYTEKYGYIKVNR